MVEEKNLLRDFAEDHPRVRAVRSQIEMTRRFLPPEKRMERPTNDDAVENYVRQLQQELADVRLRRSRSSS